MTSSVLIDRQDLDFLLRHVLDTDALFGRERFAEHSRETFDAAIATAQRMAEDLFLGHYEKSDREEPRFENGAVRVIPEARAALDAFGGAGFMASSHDFDEGGMQLPHVVSLACMVHFYAANVGTASYAMLTIAAANLIQAFGSAEQWQTFGRPMLEGRWFGTMALTEPQAGSSLADIATMATPAEDGSYRIRGNKVFTSGGDQDLSENIVHMVLARVSGAPSGVKGISLFIVPKVLPDGRRNDVALAGLIHKMGWRGTTSTMLNFGEGGDCVGFLVGEENRGLAYMFQMMNEARINVGLVATMLGYRGYLHAKAYAADRVQGRPIGTKDAAATPVAIDQHPDVRRMLLTQKASVEGALALCLYAARLLDDSETLADTAARKEATDMLGLLTPVVKSWPSIHCLKANDIAIQILGGYGYTREYPVEQLYRDNRLNPIHEGTTGIQAQDLLGRKIVTDGGQVMAVLCKSIRETAAPMTSPLARQLEKAVQTLESATAALRDCIGAGNTEKAYWHATSFLESFGSVVVGWLWLRQISALPGLDADAAVFASAKEATARHFFETELARAEWELGRIQQDCRSGR